MKQPRGDGTKPLTPQEAAAFRVLHSRLGANVPSKVISDEAGSVNVAPLMGHLRPKVEHRGFRLISETSRGPGRKIFSWYRLERAMDSPPLEKNGAAVTAQETAAPKEQKPAGETELFKESDLFQPPSRPKWPD
jgi:hypothetical protein